MITDEELMTQIDHVSGEFKGQLDDLYKIVGMIVMGRLFGWRVVRLVSTRGLWAQANKYFGDVREMMPERGKYAHKSVGLKIVDDLDEYWNVVKGVVSVPAQDKKQIM